MPPLEPHPLHCCVVIVAARGATRWQHTSLQHLRDGLGVAISGVVVTHHAPRARRRQRPGDIGRRLLDAATQPKQAARIDTNPAIDALAQRHVNIDPASHRLILSTADIDWINARGPDFVLSLDALPAPDLPALAPLGTWTYAIGNPPLPGVDYPGVRELGRHSRQLGLAIQRVVSRNTPAATLAIGHTPVVAYSRKRSLARLYEIAPDLLGMAVRDRRAGRQRRLEAPASAAMASAQPGWARFLAAIAGESLRRWFEKALYRQQWRIGLIPGHALMPAASAIDNAHWLPNPKGVFQADPGFMPADAQRLLVEEYPHATGRGRITALSGAHDHSQTLAQAHTVLDTGGHLSFPRVYRREEQLWLVPEMADQGLQHAYALDHKARLLAQPPVTIEGLHGIDPVLFEHAGRHWALLSPAGRRANYQLDLFHADHFLGPYRPHPANPIRIDPRGGRNAGPVITRDGRLYRFGQVFGRLYGEAIDVFEITTLDQHAYADNHIGRIQPADAGRSGMHSIDFADNTTVVDRFYLEPRWARWRS